MKIYERKKIPEKMDMEELSSLIELVKNTTKINWIGGVTGEKTADGKDILAWPMPDYPEGVWQSLFVLGIDENYPDNMKRFKGERVIGEMNLKQLQTFLTHIAQTERFYDGYLIHFLEDGRLYQALERIKGIYENR